MADQHRHPGRRAELRRAAPPGGRARPRRLAAVALGFSGAAALLVGRLLIVQVLDGARYAAYQQGEVDQTVALPAARGPIYDRSGDVLALSVPRYDVVADDFLISAPRAEAAALAPVLGSSPRSLTAALSQRNGYVVLARQVTAATRARIDALGLAGISFVDDARRVYSGGSLFQPLLGGVNLAGEGDAALEYQFDKVLAGRPGRELVAEAPGGLALPGGVRRVVPPRGGSGIVLTIDEPLQLEVTRDLAAQMRATHAASGIAVVEDARTGAILAMVDLVAGRRGAIGPAPTNLALTSVYQPGSVMKLATMAWALKDGLISPNSTFTVPDSIDVGGYTFQDAEIHPTVQMTARQILAQSSNVGTIEISRLLGLDRLARALSAFGFGRLTGLGWPGESPGIIGTPATWYGSTAAAVPIGTGVAVTPMQVLDAFDAVADGGVLRPPHLVAATVTPQGVVHRVPVPRGTRILSRSTAEQVVSMLEGVVRQDGTAVLASIPGYTVAGKTGTAQVPSPGGGYVPGDWNATFVGFVPAQAPALAGIVVLNHPTPIYGGLVSAPVFSRVMRYALRRFDIAPPAARPAGAARR
ncbi:MAG TPA: penicillin-binding protein 2 [Acidimicrobiales bacterium]|nr:penicillin-binding protein 2 [Acidimicrobiales bacterium]